MNLKDGTNVACPKCCNTDVVVRQKVSAHAEEWKEAEHLPQLDSDQDMFLAREPVTVMDCSFCGAQHAWNGREWQETGIDLHRKDTLQMGIMPPVKHRRTTSTGCGLFPKDGSHE